MACLSPSPSGRRLSELLEEKQDPGNRRRASSTATTPRCAGPPAQPPSSSASPARRTRPRTIRNSSRSRAASSSSCSPRSSRQGGGGRWTEARRAAVLRLVEDGLLRSRGSGVVAPPSHGEGDGVLWKNILGTKKFRRRRRVLLLLRVFDGDDKQHSPVSVLESHPFEGIFRFIALLKCYIQPMPLVNSTSNQRHYFFSFSQMRGSKAGRHGGSWRARGLALRAHVGGGRR
ncbi:hypothetical protein EJB05_27278, partial [Eragrostis curvula]